MAEFTTAVWVFIVDLRLLSEGWTQIEGPSLKMGPALRQETQVDLQ